MPANNGSMSEAKRIVHRRSYHKNAEKNREYKRAKYAADKAAGKKATPKRPGDRALAPVVKVRVRVPLAPQPTGPVTARDWNEA